MPSFLCLRSFVRRFACNASIVCMHVCICTWLALQVWHICPSRAMLLAMSIVNWADLPFGNASSVCLHAHVYVHMVGMAMWQICPNGAMLLAMSIVNMADLPFCNTSNVCLHAHVYVHMVGMAMCQICPNGAMLLAMSIVKWADLPFLLCQQCLLAHVIKSLASGHVRR